MMNRPTSSQISQSPDIERKACDVIHFLLVLEQKKVPIKKVEITNQLMKNNKGSYAEVMKVVHRKLNLVFGLKLVEIEIGVSKKAFILVSTLESAPAVDIMQWKGNSKRGLLFTVLALIFMSGEVVSDGLLWNALKGLGVEKDKPHAIFGDVKKLLKQEFSRQAYIVVTKVVNGDPPQYEYKWGPRAYHETTKRKVLEFVTQLYDKTDITVWKSQYQNVIEDEAKRDGE